MFKFIETKYKYYIEDVTLCIINQDKEKYLMFTLIFTRSNVFQKTFFCYRFSFRWLVYVATLSYNILFIHIYCCGINCFQCQRNSSELYNASVHKNHHGRCYLPLEEVFQTAILCGYTIWEQKHTFILCSK